MLLFIFNKVVIVIEFFRCIKIYIFGLKIQMTDFFLAISNKMCLKIIFIVHIVLHVFLLVMRCTAFSISSRIILAYAKVEFHCISRFATVGYCLHIVHSRPTDDGAWESEQRLRGAACLAKLRWIEIQTRCIERALTSSGNCAFLHSQFRLIATKLYAWKIGVWKILHLHEK